MTDEEKAMMEHLMKQNEILLGIISGAHVPSQEQVVPENNRQKEELDALLHPVDSSMSGGQL